ncbi:hypothetical protein AT5A_14947 [Agrobacterium tumefaciens 5A]|nr:hypothetical protein AT5A_14947 [Agrobacterium tumefaciens 5A]
MGAAESISDLRSLLSIVAEETGALKMNDADEDSVGWTTEGPLPMTFGHVRRAHSALAALEAALSAAEPVAWLVKRYDLEGILLDTELSFVRPTIKSTCRADMVPLYTSPPAPSVAVKELRWKGPDSYGEYHSLDGLWGYIIRCEDDGHWLTEVGGYFPSPEAAKAAAQSDYEARILSALSAQVQDVAAKSLADAYQKYLDASRLYNERLAISKTKALGTMRVDEERRAIDEARRAFDKLAVDIAKSALPAAPAKQEGGTNE